eukprot:6211343-Pleurochrysis_carterae.AAC.1
MLYFLLHLQVAYTLDPAVSDSAGRNFLFAVRCVPSMTNQLQITCSYDYQQLDSMRNSMCDRKRAARCAFSVALATGEFPETCAYSSQPNEAALYEYIAVTCTDLSAHSILVHIRSAAWATTSA